MTAAVHHLQYGETTIEYHLTFVDRKTLGISVLPDLTVEVKAPLDSELDIVEARVRQRANWILRQQRELERYLPHVPPGSTSAARPIVTWADNIVSKWWKPNESG